MPAQIMEIENRRNGEFYVDVNLAGKRARFENLADATKWLKLMKDSGDLDRIEVLLRQIIIYAKKEWKYETYYAM